LLDFSLKVLGDLGATDDELLLFEPYVINKMKRKDIAHEYGISEQEASNIKKRIERKLPKLRQQITNLEL
jgi:DNA-directed RNA polymerase specialized sigma subunit